MEGVLKTGVRQEIASIRPKSFETLLAILEIFLLVDMQQPLSRSTNPPPRRSRESLKPSRKRRTGKGEGKASPSLFGEVHVYFEGGSLNMVNM